MKLRFNLSGFTLIEMMITVIIIGILASIAYPSYVQYVTKANRSEALEALMRVVSLQEQYYLDNKKYVSDLTQLGLTASPYITQSGYYSVTSDINNGYKITATPQGAQLARDIKCAKISISDIGVKEPVICWR